MDGRNHVLEAWGEFACFSRPELKVERWSYPCPTPSAARGVFDAIYAKPEEFCWQITRIEVLRPIAYIALRRNEVKDVVNVTAAMNWMAGKDEPVPIWADGDKALLGSDEKGRTQRQTMALRDVRYRLHARIRPWPGHESKQTALDSQFQRRASQGKCFMQPYFGCREFPAYFQLPADDPLSPPEPIHMDIGLMLYDVFDLSRPGCGQDSPSISLFQARLVNGVLDVPAYEDPGVLKPMGRASEC